MADKLTFRVVRTATDHKGSVPITEIAYAKSGLKAFAYQCSLEEDLDGAPEAYGLDNPHPVNPKDNPDTMLQRGLRMKETGLHNATSAPKVFKAGGHDFAWVGVLPMNQDQAIKARVSIDARPFLEARRRERTAHDPPSNDPTIALAPHEKGLFPVIQPVVVPGRPDHMSPAPGYYVSTTAAPTDPNLPEWDQRRYIDAISIPYAAWAGWWHTLGVEKGDFGLAIRRSTGAFSAFLFGDAGSGRVGEVSRRLFEQLTPERNNEDRFIFLVFSGSGKGVVNKFTSEQIITAQLKHNVRRFNQIPDNEDLPEFLSDDANLTTMKAALAARHLEELKAAKAGTTRPLDAGDWRRGSITAVLRMCGFWPSSRGPVPVGPGLWADPPSPPAPARPLVF
ncbi:MAG TPA: hypothetical protein VGM07_21470 [Stellaceae bacterium]|jgi:hypothetical protein